MKLWNRILVILVVVLSCVGCDQSTKSIASHYLPKSGMDSFYSDFLRLGYTENFGAFLGMGSQLPENQRFILFTVLVGLFLTGFLIYLVINNTLSLASVVSLSLVFAGGLSNFYDRATNEGAVVDFLNIGIGSLRTGVFNIADVAILLGVFLFFVAQSLESKSDIDPHTR